MGAIFDKLNDSYAKHYSLTEHFAFDEIILLFKGTVIVKEYIPKKHKWFGNKLYRLCNSKGYTIFTRVIHAFNTIFKKLPV